ncbi:MAG: copper amine oxidase N-terminal domain-containing protein [Defluviitaleaceae bacterium]|nr:copper amine oxidase N-terminal domain-containing protein [Defluviitaleaceae bacterium]
MKKLMCAIAFLVFSITVVDGVSKIEASTPAYERQIIFSNIEELIEWIETEDATNFRSGRLEESLLDFRSRGGIFIPYISNPDVELVQVRAIPDGNYMTVQFVHNTPVGQITARIANFNSAHTATYEAEGFEAYFRATRGIGREFEISEKIVVTRNPHTGEHEERNISYALVDNLDDIPSQRFAFTVFVMDGLEMGITHRDPEVAKYFDELVWATAPITYIPSPLVATPSVIRFVVGSTTYTINGVSHTNDVAPFIDATYNRTMIPLRAASEALGAEIHWFPQSRRVSIVTGIDEHQLTVDVPLADGMGVPVIRDGRVLVPIRYVAEILGATTRWDGVNSAVYIYM